ncbi:MAG: glycosyltransferase family 2 protein [Bdellovibrionota bacterium]
MSRRLSIVIPCLNEQDAVPSVLARAHDFRSRLSEARIADLEVIVVDDGSSDGSAAAVKKFEWARLVSNVERRGYGGAIKRGIEEASGDLIAFYDMDHTYDPFDLVAMIDKLDGEGLHLVCGDRLTNCENMPITRRIGNTLFVATINFLFRQRVYDSCTGLRVFRRECREFFSGDDLPDNLNYSLAMTMHCLSKGIPLGERPIRYDRRIGRSKLSVLLDGPRFFMTIMSHWTRYESRDFVRRLTTF